MSAMSLIVLALVAVVTVQASTPSYGAKGGQSFYQEPLKGDYVMPQRQEFRQPFVAESWKSSAPMVAAPAHQQVETVAVAAAPVQQAPAAVAYEAPVKGAAPQAYYQEPASFKGSYVQHQQPLLQQRPVYQQPAQQVESFAVAAAPMQQAPATTTYEAAPVKGGQSFYQYQEPSFKGQSYYRQPSYVAAPAHQQVETAAPVQQAPAAVAYEAAPVKGGQSFYQYQEPSFKGSYVQHQQPLMQQRPVVQAAAPAQQVETVAVSAPVAVAPVQQSTATYEAPVKGGQSFYQESSFKAPLVRRQQPLLQSRPVAQQQSL